MNNSTSAAKHTPGPWFVGAQNDYLYVIDRRPSASGNDYPNHEADTELVAKPFAARGRTVEANARLIAAAPTTAQMAMDFTLLVERYVRDDTGLPTVSDAELADALYDLRAHIAKATGAT